MSAKQTFHVIDFNGYSVIYDVAGHVVHTFYGPGAKKHAHGFAVVNLGGKVFHPGPVKPSDVMPWLKA